jgi:hypothetical protein
MVGRPVVRAALLETGVALPAAFLRPALLSLPGSRLLLRALRSLSGLGLFGPLSLLRLLSELLRLRLWLLLLTAWLFLFGLLRVLLLGLLRVLLLRPGWAGLLFFRLLAFPHCIHRQ